MQDVRGQLSGGAGCELGGSALTIAWSQGLSSHLLQWPWARVCMQPAHTGFIWIYLAALAQLGEMPSCSR